MKFRNSVYGRAIGCVLATTFGLVAIGGSAAGQTDAPLILHAREALRANDGDALRSARTRAIANQHPLAQWADYWELSNRLGRAQQEELDAFYARWRGTYVEDRLRNDWLLELGRRRDWRNFKVEFPRFQMNDDREVTCYALLTEHLSGGKVRGLAREAWWAQREPDEGCALLASVLFEAKVFRAKDVWRKARLAVAENRPRTAQFALELLGRRTSALASRLFKNPARFEKKRREAYRSRTNAELMTLALMRMSVRDFESAATRLSQRWERRLPNDLVGWAWGETAKRAALELAPEATEHFGRAARSAAKSKARVDWPQDVWAWWARAALRSADVSRWRQVVEAIAAMAPGEQSDPTWVYWRARALDALSTDLSSAEAAAQRKRSRGLLSPIAGQPHFYGMLASEDLGRPLALPPRPSAITGAERKAAASHPGLRRALLSIAIGLRSEGVREWNFSLRGMGDRELLAAAQRACEHEVWDRCINTSERTRVEVDVLQRFPMPFRNEVMAPSNQLGLDPAYVYGLIRQESRFIADARSHAGASGLMQLMPGTARWTANKIGLDLSTTTLVDRGTNLRLGTGYLKLVLDEFSGSHALAAVAYNAGPRRSRQWRKGPVLEPAIWAENIPFRETRGYVKKVLANATIYEALLTGEAPSLKSRLGDLIGPRSDSAGPEGKDLP